MIFGSPGPSPQESNEPIHNGNGFAKKQKQDDSLFNHFLQGDLLAIHPNVEEVDPIRKVSSF